MARRKPKPLFEVMQESRLKQQQAASNVELQQTRERLRAARRAEDDATAEPRRPEGGFSSLLSGLKSLRPLPSEAASEHASDAGDPTAGRSVSSLYRRAAEPENAVEEPESTPAAAPTPTPTPTPATPSVARLSDEVPSRRRHEKLDTAKVRLGTWLDGVSTKMRRATPAVTHDTDAGRVRFSVGYAPIGAAAAVIVLGLIGAYFLGRTTAPEGELADINSIPVDPDVLNLGDDDDSTAVTPTTPPVVNSRLDERAAAARPDTSQARIVPPPTSDRVAGKQYVAVMSYRQDQREEARQAAADLLASGIGVTIEFDLKAYPSRYTIVTTTPVEPGSADWERFINDIKDVSEARRRSNPRRDPFDSQPLFWGNR